MGQTIATKSAGSMNRQVRIRRGNGYAEISLLKPELTFAEMMRLRTLQIPGETERSVRLLEAELATGHEFANLGVSGSYTVPLSGDLYLCLVAQDRLDMGDKVAKLISGYVDSSLLPTPLTALNQELTEELLINSHGNLMGYRLDGHDLPPAFPDIFGRRGVANIERSKNTYFVPDLETAVAVMDSKPLQGNPSLQYCVSTNSAQLIYSFYLDPELDLFENKVSLDHSEDKFNPATKMLDVVYHESGIILVKLENRNGRNDLTDYVFNLNKGELVPLDPKSITLSEAFVPKESGITTLSNIKLMEYLDLHK